MPKTMQSLILEAEIMQAKWEDFADDKQALEDLNKTREQCLQLANFFEGKRDGLCDALPFITRGE